MEHELERPEPPTPDLSAWYWQVAMHEAGHAVASFAAGYGAMLTILFDGGRGGLAYPWRSAASPFEAAIIAEAGPMAETLAARHDPPIHVNPEQSANDHKPASTRFDFASDPGFLAGLERDHSEAESDDNVRWAYLDGPRVGLRGDGYLMDRAARVGNAVRMILDANEAVIVAVARELYARRLLLPSRLRELLDGQVISWSPEIFRKETFVMLDQLIESIEQEKVDAMSAYRELVRDLAAKVKADPKKARAVLDAAGKSTDDLKQAVAKFEERFRLYDIVNAGANLDGELAKLQKQVDTADEALAKAQREHEAKVQPLHQKAAEIRERMRKAEEARAELFRSCDDDRRRTYDKAVQRAAVAERRVSELRRAIDRLHHLDPKGSDPNDDRDRRVAERARGEIVGAEREAAEALAARDEAERACQKP